MPELNPRYATIRQEYEAGASTKELALKYGITENVMYVNLKTRNTKFRPVPHRVPLSNKYHGAVEMYDSGLSLKECAAYFGVSIHSMNVALKRRGAKIRSPIQPGEINNFYRGGRIAPKGIRHLVVAATKKGILKPTPCETCGAEDSGKQPVHAHHDDYNFPLKVRYLCAACHHEWHKHNKPIPRKKS